jgi:hypothetical protein
MTTIPRDVFKNDEVFTHLYIYLKSMHKVARHTESNLLAHKHVANFCEEACHFAVLLPSKEQGGDSIYLHYNVSSWLREGYKVIVRIDSITIYDTFSEYERARVTGLHSGREVDNPNIN